MGKKQINNVRNHKKVTMNIQDICRIIKVYFVQYYADKFENFNYWIFFRKM